MRDFSLTAALLPWRGLSIWGATTGIVDPGMCSAMFSSPDWTLLFLLVGFFTDFPSVSHLS